MDNFIFAVKRIWNGIIYIISVLSGIIGILGFFKIDYKNLIPTILLVSKKIKLYTYNFFKEITYKYRVVKTILFNYYSKIIDSFSFVVARRITCVLLSLIILFLNILICGEKETATIIFAENNNIDKSKEYVPLSKTSSQPYENTAIAKDITIPYWWIKLEYPEGYPEASNYADLLNLIFYYNENQYDMIIKNEIELLINSKMESIPIGDSFTSYAYYYSVLETKLFGKNKEPLSSDCLDIIISGREELFELYPNKTIAWLLANNYQIYAFNYLKQADSADSILYFYMQSIFYAKKSLEFDMGVEDKKNIINYIRTRYKDIADCNILDNEVRVRAYEIYHAIDNAIELISIDELLSNKIGQ